MPTPPVEYQAANVLAQILRLLPDYADPDPSTPPFGLVYRDRVANTVVFTVNGMAFHAVVVPA